jgi:NitT/TauT family transport system substrate-binding protein
MALTPGFKKFVFAVVALGAIAGGIYGVKSGLIPTHLGSKSESASSFVSSSSSPSSSSSSVDSSSDKLKVSIVSFHGYAPALVANGDSLTTQPGSIFDKQGLKLTLNIQDDIPPLEKVFKSGEACGWRTSDYWAQEQPNLRNAGLDGRVVMAVDNTQGADAIITKDPSINSVEDLAGKNIGLLQFTPSHGMTIDAINNSSLSAKKKASIRYTYIDADKGTPGVRDAYVNNKVDAAVLWDPDLSLALKSGGHVVYSTKSATNLIYDVMVCDTRVINDPQGRQAIQKFVNGWMQGVAAAKANPDEAVDALVKSESLFNDLANQQGKPFIKGLFNNIVWTGLDDDARIFGLVGGTNNYERVYSEFDQIYRAAGALTNPNSPVIAPSDSVDYSFIKTALANDPQAQKQAAVDPTTFTDAGRNAATKAALTKPVNITFQSGSADLDQKSKNLIDNQIVPFIENNGSAYVEISGNTDSTGAAATNKHLSLVRAKVVANYLITQWEVPAARLKWVGNGSDDPICVEPGTNDGLTLDQCRALNRTTRVGILTQ